MKHFYLILLSVITSCISLSAQVNGKLSNVTFVGAMAEKSIDDWTKNWTNFDPKNTNYAAPTDTTSLNGMLGTLSVPGELNITGTLTLDPSKVYLLKGLVVVRAGGKLIIPAGTVIRALADLNLTPKNYASLIIERGAQLEVTGTSSKPVIFTSAKAVGSRERGDWGGILLAGKSNHNLLNGTTNDNVQMEGFNNVTFDATLARFGGTISNDNSGILRYIRLEFAGLAFEANKEINALTFGAVGSGTEVNFVQASYSNDDSFEWFGGTLNSKYLIAWKGTDDDFDTDNGFSGINQFGIGVKDTSYYDLTYSLASGSSTSEGFESDNEATGTAAVAPYTNAIFSNYTMVGPVPVGSTYSSLSSVAKAAFRRGARIRRNSSLRIVNSIFMGYRNFVMIDGDSSVRNTNFPAALNLVTPNTAVSTNKQLYFANNTIVNTAAAFVSSTDTTANGLVEVARATGSAGKLAAINSFITQTGSLANNINPVAYTAGNLLINPNAYAAAANIDFRPIANSIVLNAANFNNNNTLLAGLVTSIEDLKKANLNPVFPNPISIGDLKFGKIVNKYELFDIQGRLVKFDEQVDGFNVDNLNRGIYFIKIEDTVQKLIKE